MAKPMGSSVIKGKTIDTHLETEEGRSLLRWIVEQPLEDIPEKPWYLPWATKRNKYINEKLELTPEDPELSEKKSVKETALQAITRQVIDHETRIKQLESVYTGKALIEPEGTNGINWEE